MRLNRTEIARWGNITLYRVNTPEAKNQLQGCVWLLVGPDGIPSPHVSLPTAMMAAAVRVADARDAQTIRQWLDEFTLAVDRILETFAEDRAA